MTARRRRRPSARSVLARHVRRRSAGRACSRSSPYGAVAVAFLYSRDYLQRARPAEGRVLRARRCPRCSASWCWSRPTACSRVYLGVELLSLSLYALVAFDRDSGIAAEAAMKYFVLGAIASGTLLYGMSMHLRRHRHARPRRARSAALRDAGRAARPAVRPGVHRRRRRLQVRRRAVPHVGAGRLPRRAHAGDAVPGHGAEDRRRSRWRSGCSPRAWAPLHATGWQDMLTMLAVLSMVVGNVVAIAQTNLKRMLAYSTISHVGFILLGIRRRHQPGLPGRAVLHDRLRAHVARRLRHVILLSRAGLRGRPASRTSRACNARSPWFAARHADADVQHGGRAAVRRLLGQAGA